MTYRALSVGRVVELAARAGLGVVEWGADVHAPPGDTSALGEVRATTAAGGLSTCSYGSYWCAGRDDLSAFAETAAAATALDARRIRVWAGTEGSAGAQDRPSVVAALREAAQFAAGHGLQVALEFHPGTLADTADSTVRLLDEVGHDALSTYWQPPVNEPDAVALAGLRTVRDRVSAVHMFSWWPGWHRLPLTGRESLWREALALVGPVDLLLEFVPDDDPALLVGEARTLRTWLS
ncbi:sugar phosphate isomerase [Parafrankia colletiae]|uniref:Sugar phosphate isomerase n=1 Tax=Parafrankia colletiae TaxID=573497 RepID=A0A1S1QWU7_9ACTN|nr:sugar phosphate isomerase [Parafrankia colletiae]